VYSAADDFLIAAAADCGRYTARTEHQMQQVKAAHRTASITRFTSQLNHMSRIESRLHCTLTAA
jgi:hypothetical protein